MSSKATTSQTTNQPTNHQTNQPPNHLATPPTITASAPGKVILFGEHAVVYGEPAVAVPVTQVQATAVVASQGEWQKAKGKTDILLAAPDLGEDVWLSEAPADHPLAAAVRLFWEAVSPQPSGVGNYQLSQDVKVTVTSTIPIASGLGSGAAISAALIRALARFFGRDDLASDEIVSQLTYEVEKLHHGYPSGIDNTVVSYGRPVFFIRPDAPVKPRAERLLEIFRPGRPLHLLIGDTGVRAPTKESVGDVRRLWEAEPARMEPLFAACGEITWTARLAIEQGDLPEIGRLMSQNHAVLQKMTVSSPELDRLVEAAVAAGALGAKLSGGGRGGNMIALVTPETQPTVEQALHQAGAVRLWHTHVA